MEPTKNTEGPDGDLELEDRVLRGDAAAFSLLVERYHPRIFRIARGILGDWHHSEDVCQEVFTVVFRKLAGFQRRSRLSTWMYRVAVNAALKRRRKLRERDFARDSALTGIPSPEDTRGADLEGEEVFRKLLAPLPETLRAAVVLREQLGLSYEEMASVLGCSRGAVEQRLHRAMVALRDIWREADWLGSWRRPQGADAPGSKG